MADHDLLTRAVDELYAVAPADFVARRTALAKEARSAGDREAATQIAALRKPTVSADAVNRVVRADDPVVARLRDVAARMRQAQSALDAAGLAELRVPRDEVLAAFVVAVEADGLTSPSAQAEVRDTVVAALADAVAQEVVCSGALTRALHYSGFGEVDVSDAVARTSTGVLLTRLEGGAGRARDDGPQPDHAPGSAAEPPDESAAQPEPKDESAPEPASDVPSRPETGSAAQPEPGEDDAETDPEILSVARAALDRAEREVRRTRAEVDQATRLLTQAQRRAQSAEAAYDAALADLAELEPGDG